MVSQRRLVQSLFALLCLLFAVPVSASAQPDGPAATPVDGGVVAAPAAAQASGAGVQLMEVSEFSVSLTVRMADNGPIPAGLTWTVFGDGWTVLDSGPVAAGVTSFDVTTTATVPSGTYGLWITGNGYSSGQTIVVDGADLSHEFVLARLVVTASFPLTTSSGADVPAGTTWSIVDVDEEPVASGTLDIALPSGTVWGPEMLERGIYTLAVNAPGFTPFSTTLDLTNEWSTGFSFDVALQELASIITFDVSMKDGEPLPNGLVWRLYPNGSWDPIATGDVPAAELSFSGEHTVPYGIYSFWVQGHGYSSGRVLNANTPETPHVLVLDRKMATADVTVTTADGRDIPAGTTYTLTDSRGGVVNSLTTDEALPSPQTVGGHAELEFDVYTLTIEAPGFYPLAVEMPLTNGWITEHHFSGELRPILSTVSFTVSMSDGGPLPYGLEWAVDPGHAGTVTPGEESFAQTIGEPVELGTYALWVTGSGYSSGQVLNITGPETHHDVVLDRLNGTLTVTLTTSDEGEIPAETTWELLDAGDNIVQSGVLDEAIPNGGTLPLENPIEYGVYTLKIDPGTPEGVVPLAISALPREILPFSMTVNITDPWSSDYNVTADLQIAPTTSAVSFSVRMSDDGPLPNGLFVSLIPDGTWDPFSTVNVPAGETRFDGAIDEPVPFGTYSIWVTGHGYSAGQVLIISAPETHHDFVLDRLSGDVTITLDTSDGADVPAGTTWTIADSAGTVIQTGTLDDAIAGGGTLPVANPFAFDVYTLTIDAEGYHPFSMELPVTNPWTGEFGFTANLVSNALPEPPVTPTPEPTPAPTGTPDAPGTPVPTGTPGAPVVTELPKTGQGSADSPQASIFLLAAAMIVLAGAAGLRLHGNRRA